MQIFVRFSFGNNVYMCASRCCSLLFTRYIFSPFLKKENMLILLYTHYMPICDLIISAFVHIFVRKLVTMYDSVDEREQTRE